MFSQKSDLINCMVGFSITKYWKNTGRIEPMLFACRKIKLARCCFPLSNTYYVLLGGKAMSEMSHMPLKAMLSAINV